VSRHAESTPHPNAVRAPRTTTCPGPGATDRVDRRHGKATGAPQPPNGPASERAADDERGNPHIYIFTWLGFYGGLLGSIAGVLVAGYWVQTGQC
jgi:hypothetical protein